MIDLDIQTEYWDRAAASKTFTHPIPLPIIRNFLPLSARILDYGCGYGRTCFELSDAGYLAVSGIDISEEMIKRGHGLYKKLDIRMFDGISTKFHDSSFDACLLIAVLTCIPTNAGQERAIREILRLLRPGGIVFVSDYPLQTDTRNRLRYQEFEKELGTYGMFRTEDAVVRHHDMNHIYKLLGNFDILWQKNMRVSTMNGNESDAFQIIGRKKNSS